MSDDLIFIILVAGSIPVFGLIAWVVSKIHDAVSSRKDEVEELREQLKSVEDERDGWKNTAESTHKLLQAEHERADRFAAMNQGLAEDLAALKAYDPDQIEERLKNIREIRVEEERSALEDKLRQTIAWSMINSQLNVIRQYTPKSPTLEQTIMAQQYRSKWGF